MKIGLTSKNIAKLFKQLDDVDFLILRLFREGATTRYQILMKTKPPKGKTPKIARSTLYRRVNEKLVPLGFLEEIIKETFERGSLRLDKPIYSLTVFKGVMASTVHENISLNGLSGWVRWVLQFNMDLSEVKLDSKFFLWTILFAISDHPEWFPLQVRTLGDNIKKDSEKLSQMMEQFFKEPFLGIYKTQIYPESRE